MSKKQKVTPSQLAMSEVLKKELDSDVTKEKETPKMPVSEKPKEVKTKKMQQARKRGKNYVNARAQAKETGTMTPQDAITLLQKILYTKFEETLELHINVIESALKGEVTLPHSTGKRVSVVAASDEIIEKLEKGIVDFDILVATPAIMPKLTKFAKLLGPKGLMPNPKAGTLGPNTDDLVKKFSGNTTRFKTEAKSPIIHLTIGKTKSPVEHLVANIEAYLTAVGRKNIKSAYLSSSMSPSVQITI